MRGLKQSKNKKFEYYLRQCSDCNQLFKAQTRKGKYCSDCKKVRIKIRIKNSLTSRGIIKEAFEIADMMIDNINKHKDKEVERELSNMDNNSNIFR